jgi:aminobenzoyl-glutamate transport protein
MRGAGIIIPQAIAKWALLAPIFIPLFLRLGTGPAVVLAAYRVGEHIQGTLPT